MFRPDATALILTPSLALAAGAAGIALHVSNLTLLFGMITILKGKEFWHTWKYAWGIDAIQEGALMALRLVGALVVAQTGWGLLPMIVPFVLCYYGFRRSVGKASEIAKLKGRASPRIGEEAEGVQGDPGLANTVHQVSQEDVRFAHNGAYRVRRVA